MKIKDMMIKNKSIADELENREIPICIICKENPQRQGAKTCSTECSKIHYKECKKEYQKTDKCKEYQKKWLEKNKEHMKKYRKKYKKNHKQSIHEYSRIRGIGLFILRNNHIEEFKKICEKLKNEKRRIKRSY